jgi:hypothetical protein
LSYDRQWRWKQYVNALGAVATAVVTAVFAITKFGEGAWVIVLLIPSLTWGLSRIRRHYRQVASTLSLAGATRTAAPRSIKTIVMVDRLHASTLQTINFVLSLDIPWIAVHVSIDAARTAELKTRWQQRFPGRELTVLPSPYRSLTEPLITYLQEVRHADREAFIHVVMGELIMDSFWEQTLHENSALVLEFALRHLEGVVVTTVPFQLRRVRAEAEEGEGGEEQTELPVENPSGAEA